MRTYKCTTHPTVLFLARCIEPCYRFRLISFKLWTVAYGVHVIFANRARSRLRTYLYRASMHVAGHCFFFSQSLEFCVYYSSSSFLSRSTCPFFLPPCLPPVPANPGHLSFSFTLILHTDTEHICLTYYIYNYFNYNFPEVYIIFNNRGNF